MAKYDSFPDAVLGIAIASTLAALDQTFGGGEDKYAIALLVFGSVSLVFWLLMFFGYFYDKNTKTESVDEHLFKSASSEKMKSNAIGTDD